MRGIRLFPSVELSGGILSLVANAPEMDMATAKFHERVITDAAHITATISDHIHKIANSMCIYIYYNLLTDLPEVNDSTDQARNKRKGAANNGHGAGTGLVLVDVGRLREGGGDVGGVGSGGVVRASGRASEGLGADDGTVVAVREGDNSGHRRLGLGGRGALGHLLLGSSLGLGLVLIGGGGSRLGGGGAGGRGGRGRLHLLNVGLDTQQRCVVDVVVSAGDGDGVVLAGGEVRGDLPVVGTGVALVNCTEKSVSNPYKISNCKHTGDGENVIKVARRSLLELQLNLTLGAGSPLDSCDLAGHKGHSRVGVGNGVALGGNDGSKDGHNGGGNKGELHYRWWWVVVVEVY